MLPRQPITYGDIWSTLQEIGFGKLLWLVLGGLVVSGIGYLEALPVSTLLTIWIVVFSALFCSAVASLKANRGRNHSIPMIIFDENNSIVFNGGAAEYINDIKVEKEHQFQPPHCITISFNRHISREPFLSSACVNLFHFEAIRGNKFDWVYRLHSIHYQDPPVPNLFRLELLD